MVCGRVYCTHITGRGGRLTVMCFVSRGELTFVCTHSWKGAITPVISLCWCDNLCVIVFGCIINLKIAKQSGQGDIAMSKKNNCLLSENHYKNFQIKQTVAKKARNW